MSPSDYNAQNQRAIFIDYEGYAYMNLDGTRCETQAYNSEPYSEENQESGDRSSDVWVADGVRVRVDWIVVRATSPLLC